MWLQQTWHQSSWSGFDFDKHKNFMGRKWSADWGTINIELQYTALLDLMNFHFISVGLGCVSVSRPVSSCLVLSPSPSPVPHFCPSLPLSLRLGSYLVPTFLFACFPVYLCFLSAYWNFTCAFCSEETVRQSAAPGGTRCISSSIVSCVGTVIKTPASLEIEIWRDNTMEAWQSEDVSVCTSSTSFFCISRTMLNAGVCDVTVQRILCSCFGLFGAIVIAIKHLWSSDLPANSLTA